ncbi:heme-binding protein 2-like [Lytechinus pictus]|uniref:heme-binding protein 2-like n=1 Tax=Lytechinus pictus TaxID=7653 RepID=UPI0030B9B0DC
MMTAVKSVFTSSHLQMPEYEPVKTYEKGYEERRYEPSRWVSTSLDLMTSEEATISKKERRESFFKLFNYISGENEGSQKIEMTAPVARQYIPGQGPACETKYTMSFFVPREFTENTPKPKAPDVSITNLPQMTVFVKKFSGFADDDKYLEEMKRFVSILEEDGHQVKDDVYYFAGYDSPFKLLNRRNEVWLVKDCEDGQLSHQVVPNASSDGDPSEKLEPSGGEEQSYLENPAGAVGGAEAAGTASEDQTFNENSNEIGMD